MTTCPEGHPCTPVGTDKIETYHCRQCDRLYSADDCAEEVSAEDSNSEPRLGPVWPYGYRFNFSNELFKNFANHLDLNPMARYAASLPKIDLEPFRLFTQQVESIQHSLVPWASITHTMSRPLLDTILSKSWMPNMESVAAGAFSFFRNVAWAEYADRLDQADWRRILPANLRDVEGLRREHLLDVLTDPLPLYAVPQAETIEALLDCEDGIERRRLIGRKRDSIVEDCSNVLGQITNPAYRYEISSLNEAIAVMQAGSWQAGQALATTVMDSLIWKWGRVDGGNRHTLTGRSRSVTGVDEFDLEAHLVMLPIFHAHEPFTPGKSGALVPRDYNRHASLHAVSHRQYNQRNAVIALMMATSLAWYMHLNY